MPGAVTLFVLSQKYKMNKNIVVEMIIISTVLSIITLPILTSFLL